MAGIHEELKRRNIYKVGLAYALVAWLIIQVTADMVHAYGLSPAAMPFLYVMLLTGMPVILLFSWAYEITPGGMMKTDEVDPAQSIARKTGKTIDKIILAALILAVGYYAFNKYNTVDEVVIEEVSSGN